MHRPTCYGFLQRSIRPRSGMHQQCRQSRRKYSLSITSQLYHLSHRQEPNVIKKAIDVHIIGHRNTTSIKAPDPSTPDTNSYSPITSPFSTYTSPSIPPCQHNPHTDSAPHRPRTSFPSKGLSAPRGSHILVHRQTLQCRIGMRAQCFQSRDGDRSQDGRRLRVFLKGVGACPEGWRLDPGS